MKALLILIIFASIIVMLNACGGVYNYLKNKEVKTPLFGMEILMVKYVNKYRIITKQETGKVGPLYYQWLVSLMIVLVSIVIVLLL